MLSIIFLLVPVPLGVGSTLLSICRAVAYVLTPISLASSASSPEFILMTLSISHILFECVQLPFTFFEVLHS